MTETDQRLTELENQIKDVQSVSGGILKLLLLSLSFQTQNESLTDEQKEKFRESANYFFDKNDEQMVDVFQQMVGDELTELQDIVKSIFS